MIIGVVGPLCAGKDTFSKILSEMGFVEFSFGNVLRHELQERGIEITRGNLQILGNELRERWGPDFIAKKIIAQINDGRDYVIQGFRNPAEVTKFRKLKDFLLVSLNSSLEKRFERMVTRGRERDPSSLEEFRLLDRMELKGIGQGEQGLHIGRCMEIADKNIVNSGNIKELKEKIKVLYRELQWHKR